MTRYVFRALVLYALYLTTIMVQDTVWTLGVGVLLLLLRVPIIVALCVHAVGIVDRSTKGATGAARWLAWTATAIVVLVLVVCPFLANDALCDKAFPCTD